MQSEAALALLEELKAEPRKETLAIAVAQVGLAGSNLKVARDQYDKDRASYDIDPKSISQNPWIPRRMPLIRPSRRWMWPKSSVNSPRPGRGVTTL